MTARVAVIGAGLAGSLTALGLARRGVEVDLIERRADSIGEASLFNEGKVHLGFLYAHDRTRATSRLMIEGATTFRGIVADLTGFDVATALSTPFVYAVHHESLVSPDEFESHLHECCREFAAAIDTTAQSTGYVDGHRQVHADRLARSAWSDDLDPGTFAAVFQTTEYSVDPRRLGPEVTRAVNSSSRVTTWSGVGVDRITPRADSGWSLWQKDRSPAAGGDYDVVVNATWGDLLRLDSQVGIEPPSDWSYRFKLGNRVLLPVSPDDLKSVTVVLGAFGDIVNFGDQGGIFLSWYPTGRLLMTDAVDLPDWNSDGFRSQRVAAYEQSRVVWESMSTSLKALDIAGAQADTRGGMILATGRLDVDDPTSPLHSRMHVGIQTTGTYVSVNTGKFTLAPLMALRASDAVMSLIG